MECELKAWERRNMMAQLPIMLTIPDSLLMCITHLETVREWFKYFKDLFNMKKSDTTQQEAKCNPRTTIDMRQKHREDTRKLQECKATANKPESTKAVESRDSKRREWKCKARERRRVEKMVERGERKATERTSERGAAGREPGEEATDETTRSVSLTVTLSSQDDDGRDMAVPCLTVKPQRPKTMRQAVNHAAADTVIPNMTSAGSPDPAGTSHELRDELRKSMGSYPGSRGKNDDSRAPGAHCMHVTAQRPHPEAHCMHVTAQELQIANPTAVEAAADAVNPNATSARPTEPAGAPHMPQDEPQMEVAGQRLTGRGSKEVATAKGPGEDATDREADGLSLAALASSQNTRPQPGDQPRSASEQSRQVWRSDVHEQDHRRYRRCECDRHTPSVPLEGEQENQVVNGSTGVHSDTAEMWGDAQKCTNSARASQRRDASANGEGRSAWTGRHHTGSVDRPESAAPQDDNDNEEVKSRASGRPPSMPLEGERIAQRHASGMHAGHQPSNGCMTSDSGRVPNGIVEDPGGRVEPKTQTTNGHCEKAQSPPLEEQRGAHSQRHANDTCTGQRHANTHSEGHSVRAEQPSSIWHKRNSCTRSAPDGIAEDPGGGAKPSASGQTPAAKTASSTPAPPMRQAQYLEAEEDCQHKGMRGDAPTPLSTPLEDEQDAQSNHAHEEVHTRSGTKAEDDIASHQDGTNPKEDDAPATHIRASYDPGGDILKRSQLREVEGEIGDRSDEDSIVRDGRARRMDSTTSSTSRDSK
ncbi:hypothetical protein BU15DRAFT_79854 [Melanogaster broomeanus]|nr:hypothetical protein BU15DRAFT_79854 [Melanogaster broomeanus]